MCLARVALVCNFCFLIIRTCSEKFMYIKFNISYYFINEYFSNNVPKKSHILNTRSKLARPASNFMLRQNLPTPPIQWSTIDQTKSVIFC
jgi:hypothetical protein